MTKIPFSALALIAAALPQIQAQAQEHQRVPVDTGAEESMVLEGPEQQVRMHKVSLDGEGQFIGIIRVVAAAKGAYFEPALEGLEPGMHGFHIHENPSCEPDTVEGSTISTEVVPAGAAGGHFNPSMNRGHTGPYGMGHVGDLPNIWVDESGVAELPVYAPRVQVSDLEGRSLVIHENPDNYSSEPENGGSGGRIACGIIP